MHRSWIIFMGVTATLALSARAAAPAVRWENSLKKATARAKKEERPLVILFTSEMLQRTTRRCRFLGRNVRAAVADANAVCVRLLKPKAPTAAMIISPGNANIGPLLRLSKKDYNKRLAVFKKAMARYGVKRLPSVVIAYPEGEVFRVLRAPRDEEIVTALRHLKKAPLAAPVEQPPIEPDLETLAAELPEAGPTQSNALSDLEMSARVNPFESEVDPEDF